MEFKFGDRVKITSGFYTDYEGELRAHREHRDEYWVRLDNFMNDVIIKSKHIELLKGDER